MVRIKRTTGDAAQRVRYGSVYGRHVEFDRGEQVIDPDVDTAYWAADQFDAIELVVPDLPTDYRVLASAASIADGDAVTGNDPRKALMEWLDGLHPYEREALVEAARERVGVGDGEGESDGDGDADGAEADGDAEAESPDADAEVSG